MRRQVRRDDQLVGGKRGLAIAGAELAIRHAPHGRASSASSSSASSASNAGKLSPTGDDVPTLPPSVARAWICSAPISRAAATSGDHACERGLALDLEPRRAGADPRAVRVDGDAAQARQAPEIEDPDRRRAMVRVDHEVGAARHHHEVGMRGAQRERFVEIARR